MQVQTVNTFRLGRSTVVTLPKPLGIKSGTALKVSKSGKTILLEPKIQRTKLISKKERIKNNLEKVRKLAGTVKTPFLYTPDEVNKMIDEEYDEYIDKSVLLRR